MGLDVALDTTQQFMDWETTSWDRGEGQIWLV